MYDKEQIIAEIKRIAKSLKVKDLKKSDFMSKTMIPANTIDFYISSWKDAIAEAGLEDDSSVNISVTDKELLIDLLRLEKEFGEIPTFSRIEKSGKFSKKNYQIKWRSIEDAMKIARKKYYKSKIETPDKTIMMKPVKKEQEEPDSSLINLEDTMVSRKREDLGIEIIKKRKDESAKRELDFSDVLDTESNEELEEVESEFSYSTDSMGIEEIITGSIKKPKKKKIIPETIKPKIKEKDKNKSGAISFRGIKSAPVDVKGVIFIFGMICEELSFIIETFNTEKPYFEGKRSLDGSGKKMQDVKIGVYHKSHDLKTKSESTTDYDIIICWEHDWNDCPVEVLELKAVIKKLDPN